MRQKYDPSGAPVTQVPILDRNGRTPAQQLNDPVTELRERLSGKGVTCQISKAVILTHQDVRLGTVNASTVQIISRNNIQPFLWEICRSASSSIPTERIVECIKEDHDYWRDRQDPTPQPQQGSCA